MAKRRIPWKERCGAKRTNGEPCRKWAIYGCRRCKLHGGLSPNALAKAPERLELVARATVQPAIDVVIECLTNGPRRKRLEVALAVLTVAGILDDDSADIVESMEIDHPVVNGQ